ncbi:MmgE/PrpD family protein [Hydrogenophaga sp. BPS33]|uniref:MmgE/PrpD family protein n=1 Tax=Hydrogenophaga sp. BPS33 TaxID=2651974 RepID=UPI00131FCF99|nr:MmgE/PrpD family protein [Hydrogenophaga sp. BPS33]QHE87545.1 MmgE/PrpD family protein [Hydrogenophaga sp. BPS33]
MTSLTQGLARRIHTARIEHFSEWEREQSAKVVMDTLAVMVGGAMSELREPILNYLGMSPQKGPSRVLGTDWRLPPELSALVNGTFGAALDFDDVVSTMPGHPSAIVMAVVAAELDLRTISGRDLIEAHIVGLEVSSKLGVGLTKGYYDRGFHGTCALGVFVGVAVLACLRRLDEQTIAAALGMASSMSSGLRCNFGTMTKALHTGWAAQWSVHAVNLAQSGVTACTTALEANAGYFETYGDAASDTEAVLRAWGEPWAIRSPGVGLRNFACYNALQRPMHAVLDLKSRVDLTPASLQHLSCWMHPGGMQGAIYPRPTTGFEGKFSLQYVLAAGVLDGAYSLQTFTDEAVNRPAIQALLKKIEACEMDVCGTTDPQAIGGALEGAKGFVQVSVTLASGAVETCRLSVAPGHPARPLGWDELHAKFMDCARFAHFPVAKAEAACALLQSLETCADIKEIADLLVAAPASRDAGKAAELAAAQ